jgi:hypothetical protein
MTALQEMYLAARAGRQRGHHAALRHLERQTGIDAATLDRCLRRARRTDELEARRGASA